MDRKGTSSGLRLVALLAAACLVLPLGASLEAIEHLGHHAEAGDFVHSEASHPDAAPHLEREEHLSSESCVVCAHGSTGGATAWATESSSAFETERVAWELKASLASASRTACPARAPPA